MTISRKVLVVDDYGDLLELLGKILTLLGWQPILANSGQDALSKLQHGLPSVVLLDMRMSHMSGFELAGILKSHPVYGKIPILAASAYPGFLVRKRCLAAGCDDFIAKPFAIPALATRLTDLAAAAGQKAMKTT